MVDQKVSSTGDDRTANNAMRHTYRVLSEEEKDYMTRVKDMGADFTNLLHQIGRTTAPNEDGADHRFASRNLSLAFTAMEDAVMRAVKHITR